MLSDLLDQLVKASAPRAGAPHSFLTEAQGWSLHVLVRYLRRINGA
jgi:hypothetical protein